MQSLVIKGLKSFIFLREFCVIQLKQRKTEIDSLINLLLYSFRNGNNLPFTIPTKTCPDLKPSKKEKRKPCRKRHSEIIVESYLPEEKKYRLLYYGMHSSKDVFTFDQNEDMVKIIIRKSIMRKKYGGKTLLEVRNVKKLLMKKDIVRTKLITFRVSEKEKKSIIAKAEKRNLEISDYIRMKLFS